MFKKNLLNKNETKKEEKSQCYIAIASIIPGENLDMTAIFNGDLDSEFQKSARSNKSSAYFKVRCEMCDSFEEAVTQGKKLANTPNRVWILTMACRLEKMNEVIQSGHFSKTITQATNSQDWQLFQSNQLDEKKIRIIKNPNFFMENINREQLDKKESDKKKPF